jgi:hypothetical protein
MFQARQLHRAGADIVMSDPKLPRPRYKHLFFSFWAGQPGDSHATIGAIGMESFGELSVSRRTLFFLQLVV